MIDREARDQLAALLHGCLNDQVTWEEAYTMRVGYLDSRDAAVREAARCFVWVDDEDFGTGFVKSQWDLCQRWLLLLESDAEWIEADARPYWQIPQIVAACCLVALAVAAIVLGLGHALLVATVPISLVVMLAWRSMRREQTALEEQTSNLVPFPDYASLAAVRRSVPQFRKQLNHDALVWNHNPWPARLVLFAIRVGELCWMLPVVLVIELLLLLLARPLRPPARVVLPIESAAVRT